jgi:hypothetical protein
MAMITITFNPTSETQARLIGDLMAQYLRVEADIADTVEPVEVKEVAPPTPKPRKTKPAPEPVAEPEAPAAQPASLPAAKPTIVDVRAVLGPLSQAGKAGEVKALLAEFGVTKLTELAEEQYADLLAKAKEL